MTPIACHECDLLLMPLELRASRSQAFCPRCGARLYACHHDRLEKILALTVAALTLLLTAISFPIVGLDIQGHYAETTVLDAALALWREERGLLAGLVLLTTVLMPLFELGAILWLALPLWRGWRPWGFARVFRLLRLAHPWAMVEVFVLGVLVSLVKLSHLADVLPGPAMACFGGLMALLAALSALIDPPALWQAWDDARPLPSVRGAVSGRFGRARG
ncbi:paraquat-inducible protein A [uncultured Propionivibrio sp.]|uniref:paraquat-inducible protein A n=1 Tax=uncultured Propionivibrio sp. TaxID=426737 RepID=UPI0029C0EA4E|nr:paraquat-inducible protein A [uncultured Propionivibrio sp.]